MRTALAILILLAGVLAPGQSQSPQSAPPAKTPTNDTPSFGDFSVLVNRNIFDPNRRPSFRQSTYTPPPAPATDRISLGGVLLDKGEAVAFFEGSAPEYNASIRLGGVIAGFRLTAIQTDRVQMARNDRKLMLPVAAQLARRPKGDWEVTTDTTPIASGFSSASVSGSSSPTPPTGGGSQDDMIKKLMERRRKELGQ